MEIIKELRQARQERIEAMVDNIAELNPEAILLEPQSFYNKAQKSFINIAKKNRKTHYIFDNSKDNPKLEKNILDIVLKKIKF